MSGRFLRKPAVLESTGLSRSAMHRMIAAGQFPKPRPLMNKLVFWLESDVDAWKAKVLGGSDGGNKE